MSNISFISLILANTTPLLGVLFFGWNLSTIIFIYWVETIIIVLFSLLKMFVSKTPIKEGIRYGKKELRSKTAIMLYSIVFYGLSLTVYAMFLFTLFIPSIKITSDIIFSILSLFFSHGVAFGTNYLRNKEYEQVSPEQLFKLPYTRDTIMLITLLVGSFIVVIVEKNNVVLLTLLVVCKTIADVQSRIKYQKKN